MKRTLALVLSLTLALGFASAFGGVAVAEGKNLNIWVAASDNMRILFEKWIEVFNSSAEYNPNGHTAILQFLPAGAGGQTIDDKLLAAVGAGQTNTDFDLVELGDDQTARLLGEAPELMMPYDAAKIPNLANVSARPPIGAEFFMPYRGTTVVMAYNSEAVPQPPKTRAELTQWIKDHPGRFTYNTPGTGGAGDSFARTSVYDLLPEEALMSDDAKWTEQWDAGFKYLAEIHPNLYQSGGRVVYPNKNQGSLDLLAEGQIDICPIWADMAISQIQQGVLPATTKIYQIEPSLTGAVNTLAIPTFGSNPDGAHDFMNFVLSPEAQLLQLQMIAAIPLIHVDDEAAALVAELDVSKFRTQSIGELYVKFNMRWDEEIATLS
ncbi:MAG: extracellular solute-binding protein [Eubacteriales bacterium]|nr:extracellular solute-binding protein [Eubacteriales bacterium]